jgi:hypothetical protein
VPAEWKLPKAIIESQEPTGLWHYKPRSINPNGRLFPRTRFKNRKMRVTLAKVGDGEAV